MLLSITERQDLLHLATRPSSATRKDENVGSQNTLSKSQDAAKIGEKAGQRAWASGKVGMSGSWEEDHGDLGSSHWWQPLDMAVTVKMNHGPLEIV